MLRNYFAPWRLCVSLFLIASAVALAPDECAAFELKSPDGRVVIAVDAAQSLTWSASVGGRAVLLPSKLRMELVDGPFPAGPVRVDREQLREIDETWEWKFGARRQIKNRCREATLTIVESRSGGRKFNLVLRAYNDGVALRYVFPEDFAVDVLKVKAEQTEFTFDKDYSAWIGDHKTNFGHQECAYPAGPLSRLGPESFGTAPIVVDMGDNLYVALAEASLFRWAGMYFCGTPSPTVGGVSDAELGRPSKAEGGPKSASETPPTNSLPHRVTLLSKLSTRPAGEPLDTVVTRLPARSPWRVVMIGHSPGDLVESDLLLNLNDPTRLDDTSWIKPGMSAWDHWWSGEQKMETAVIREYIDLAADMGWPYQLIDWWWYGDPDAADADVFKINPALDLPEIRRYAAAKGVKLWMWLQWDDVERNHAYEKLFPLLHEWGIVGVKIDFMQRDDQWMVEWYQRIVKLAADNELMVDFHGAYKPTGEQRTWPNLITREGVKGNEWNKWSQDETPTHKATLPFTRMLMGPMDFTPGGFINRQPAKHQISQPAAQVQGTRANELALFVVYLSPFMCVCEHPDQLRGQPGAEFLKIVPTVWDETHVLAGEIGRYAVIARQSGDRWFVGGITNEEARKLTLDFGFLKSGRWHAKIWADGAKASQDATDLAVSEIDLGDKRTLPIDMAPAGGFAVLFEPDGKARETR